MDSKPRLDHRTFVETQYALRYKQATDIIGPPSTAPAIEHIAHEVIQACKRFVLGDPVRKASASHESRIQALEQALMSHGSKLDDVARRLAQMEMNAGAGG